MTTFLIPDAAHYPNAPGVTLIYGGELVSGANPIPISGSISATNPSVSATGGGVPGSATYLGGNNGGNLIGLVTDASGFLKVNIAAGSSSGTQYTDAGTPPTNPVGGAIVFDNSGTWVDVGADHPLPVSGTFWQTTQPVSVASLPALPANQSVNNVQINGNTMSVDSGTSGNGTQRVITAGAASGTKSNVASSATSVTILAANTNRKGAMVYNDSTQILYLDLSGGTASNSSYSVQIPSQGFFELPGSTIYNGAITGIWASANGNARVTEFS